MLSRTLIHSEAMEILVEDKASPTAGWTHDLEPIALGTSSNHMQLLYTVQYRPSACIKPGCGNPFSVPCFKGKKPRENQRVLAGPEDTPCIKH